MNRIAWLMSITIIIHLMNSKFIDIVSNDERGTINLDDNEVIGDPFETSQYHIKYKTQQKYKGIPIFGATLVVEEAYNKKRIPISGKWYNKADIEQLVPSIKPKFTEDEALHIALNELDISLHNLYSTTRCNLYIYHHKTVPFLCWILKFSYFKQRKQNEIHHPMIIINALNGNILEKYDELYNINVIEACGDGGNEATGLHQYCVGLPALLINDNIRPVLQNDVIQVYDLNGMPVWLLDTATAVTCSNLVDSRCYIDDGYTNGAYCPACDAYAFGNVVVEMFDKWTNATYPISQVYIPMKLYIHVGGGLGYSAGYEAGEMFFGDGDSMTHPTTSLDIIAHEIAHGYTEQGSNLAYFEESGAMNEAFSDITGEVAKYYFSGANDWKVGGDVSKIGAALRYMYDPPLDGVSIDQYADYYGQNVHYTSGLFNKAAYNLNTNTNGVAWSMEEIFRVFAWANLFYWTQDSTFSQGISGLYQALYDIYDDNVTDVDGMADTLQVAFADVGLQQVDTNQTIPTLHTVHCGDSFTGSTTHSGDIHYYLVNISNNGSEYSLLFDSCGSLYDTYLYFYDSNFNVISECDDCGSCGTEAQLRVSSVLGGTYILGIGGFATEFGQYVMTITCTRSTQPTTTQPWNNPTMPTTNSTEMCCNCINPRNSPQCPSDAICTADICASDSYCCTDEWDVTCTYYAMLICEEIDTWYPGFSTTMDFFPSDDLCGMNRYCYYIDMYPSDSVATEWQQNVYNLDDYTETTFDLYFTSHGNECKFPSITMDYEYIDYDSYSEYIDIYDNSSVLLHRCGGSAHSNLCGVYETCFQNDYLQINEINVGSTYRIRMIESSAVDALCYHQYSINATLTMHCEADIMTSTQSSATTTSMYMPATTATTLNASCKADKCYYETVTQTNTMTSITNYDNNDASLFYVYYAFEEYECNNPRLTFEYEKVDIDRASEYMTITANGTFIADCGTTGNNQCGDKKQCFSQKALDKDIIKIGQVLKVSIFVSETTNALCETDENEAYTINAQLILICNSVVGVDEIVEAVELNLFGKILKLDKNAFIFGLSGCILLICILLFAVIRWCRKNNQRKRKQTEDGIMEYINDPLEISDTRLCDEDKDDICLPNKTPEYDNNCDEEQIMEQIMDGDEENEEISTAL